MDFREFKDKYQKKKVEEISYSPPKKPVVSVLVQTYQQKDFIKECLDSIIMQETTFDFEILVGDDGSTDGTRDICLEYAERYPGKIRLFLHHRDNQIKVMGEPTSNFNAFYNFFSARGKFIAFCEGDDYWADPYKLQKQLDALNNKKEVVLTFHKFKEIYVSPDKHNKILEQPTFDLKKEELQKLTYHPLLSTICFRNHPAVSLPAQIMEVLNVDSFLISILGNYGSGKFLENVKPSLYRRHPEGSWSSKTGEKRYLLKIHTFKNLQSFYSQINKTNLSSLYKKKVKQNYRSLSKFYWENTDFGKTFTTLFQSF